VCFSDGRDIACNAPSLYVTSGGLSFICALVVDAAASPPDDPQPVCGVRGSNKRSSMTTMTAGRRGIR
jgi:hypothetical protein